MCVIVSSKIPSIFWTISTGKNVSRTFLVSRCNPSVQQELLVEHRHSPTQQHGSIVRKKEGPVRLSNLVAEICLPIGSQIWPANEKTKFNDPGWSGCKIERGQRRCYFRASKSKWYQTMFCGPSNHPSGWTWICFLEGGQSTLPILMQSKQSCDTKWEQATFPDRPTDRPTHTCSLARSLAVSITQSISVCVHVRVFREEILFEFSTWFAVFYRSTEFGHVYESGKVIFGVREKAIRNEQEENGRKEKRLRFWRTDERIAGRGTFLFLFTGFKLAALTDWARSDGTLRGSSKQNIFFSGWGVSCARSFFSFPFCTRRSRLYHCDVCCAHHVFGTFLTPTHPLAQMLGRGQVTQHLINFSSDIWMSVMGVSPELSACK